MENLKLIKLSEDSPKKEGYYFCIMHNSLKEKLWFSFKYGFETESETVYGWYDEVEPLDAINWDSVWIRYCHDDNAQEDAETFVNYLKTKFPNGISFNEPDWSALELAFYAGRGIDGNNSHNFRRFEDYKNYLIAQ